MEKNFKVVQINFPQFQSFQRIKAEELNSLILSLKNPRTLELQKYYFGLEGIQVISRSLSKCTTLEYLDLSYNLICSEAFSCLSKVLFRMKSLRNLNLSNNLIGGSGSSKLSFNLTQFSSLILLDISSNNLGLEGASNISKTISSLISLKVLILSNNSLADSGSLQIISSLKPSQDINYICLRNNFITPSGMAKLLQKVRCFKNLRLFHVDKDPCKEMKYAFMLHTVGMKGIQGDISGLKLCGECGRHCDPNLCIWSRLRPLYLLRITKSKLV